MYLKGAIMTYTQNFLEQISKIKSELEAVDAILIGAGAGLSASAGLTYSGERFFKYFADFHAKYGITDIYLGGFYPYDTLEEYWAWWSRHILYNRYEQPPLVVYENLLSFVKNRNYFVLTTNVDHCFQNAGFDKARLFYTQGDYGLLQCSVACHNKTYDNEDIIRKMVIEQNNMKIPTELIPYCPVCGKPMTTNLRSDDKFVQDNGWAAACKRYEDFISKYGDKRILLLELGVGGNTPAIIKYPFWRITMNNPQAMYVCINNGEAFAPKEIQAQSLCLNGDIGKVLEMMK
ncbi:Sir2 silent information regulator family NAD-dependent deacetylase [Helicobacter sp. MIT 05-5293]|nr:Sir2 silent information regulator family NAD-dependent deacetylase [Helicobacter sp. MIT 05-5293]